MKNNTVIVGGGIAGLMSAYILSKTTEDNIIVIEQENEVGGLLKKFDYGKYGVFDHGMHNILQTTIKELDDMIFNLLPTEEWQILDDNKRDLVGLYVNNNIQINSPYIDIRNFENYDDYLSDFFDNYSASDINIDDYNSANEFLKDKYGEKIVDNILKDIVEKFYKCSISELDPLSTLVTPLGRVILLNEEVMKEFNKVDTLRKDLAYSEQRNLDLSLSSGRKAYYPKNYGIHRVIDSLVEKLKDRGVEFLLESQITSIEYDNRVNSINVNSSKKVDNINQFIWTGNLFRLSNFLDIKVNSEFDIPAKTTVTNIVIDKKLNKVDDVYYMYCYDNKMSTFRVTPYYNYCEGSKRAGGYPVSVEMLVYDEIDDINKITEQAILEISEMGLIDDDINILFKKTEVLKRGFPRPTIKNMKSISSAREKINELRLENLITTGILAEKNLFFQTDVLIDLYNKLKGIK
ncbi:NAD(P)-binding protein [Halarcobacter sp.]|uniref:NAD(P)-binding protein n=1 Tax=Halarcobacter sp. TaxID=2321133 RepID=UPI002AAC1628|nr:NAD(P)-binding protein [Halarcobacter sp.]